MGVRDLRLVRPERQGGHVPELPGSAASLCSPGAVAGRRCSTIGAEQDCRGLSLRPRGPQG
eukprot:14909578-Alexandrium_andersonii.AAC.1